MKTKILAMLACSLLTSFSLQAQMQRMTIEDRVKATMEKLSPLQLDQDQQKKTSAAFTDYYTKQQKTMQDARDKGERPDMAVFEKIRAERDVVLKGIFTDEQYKQFKDELEATLRPQRRGQ